MSKVGIFANINKKIMPSALIHFFRLAERSDHEFIVTEALAGELSGVPEHIRVLSMREMLDVSQLIVSFGGDGTMLRSAQLVGEKEIPILGINLGGLGFLTGSSVELSMSHIDQFFTQSMDVEERSLLELSISGDPVPKYLLNDFVVDKAGFSRLINITVTINGLLLNSYLADGLIVSTPTGSTAYSLANGGPIVVPTTNAFIVHPICPHTLSNRPLVIPDNTNIAVSVESEIDKFNVFGDGNKIGTFPTSIDLHLKKAGYHVFLVQTPGHEFYNIIREKLGWGESFRNKNRTDDFQ